MRNFSAMKHPKATFDANIFSNIVTQNTKNMFTSSKDLSFSSCLFSSFFCPVRIPTLLEDSHRSQPRRSVDAPLGSTGDDHPTELSVSLR